jgi:ABC-2 type transport system ATP-binding protein
MAGIEVQDLRKVYGETVALDGVSFAVEPGEVVGFLGPNGAGKSTAMRILTGFLAPTSGTATVDGFDTVTQSIEVRRRIGYLPESAPVYREMRVDEYLRFVCAARSMPRAERRGRIDETAERVGLTDVLRRPIGELSKGYRQRVGLAQAMVHDPPILILDEPTTGLDPNQLAGIRELVIEIGATRTVLLSSHILQEVQAMCGRVLIVNSGRIVGFGTPAELEARASGGARIELVVQGGVGLRAAFEAISGVVVVDDSAGEGPGTQGWTLMCSAGVDPRADVFAAVVSAGGTLLELRREGGRLEDVFRTLTA